MLQEIDIIVPWQVLDMLGQWSLLFLLVTYAMGRHLPQRNNAYLVNFILTTFLTTIPPALLLYTGHQYSRIPKNLCLAQAVLVDGVTPMFAMAQFALIFDTWSELRSLCLHKRHISRMTFLKCILLIAPYFMFGFWTFASYGAAWGDPSNFDNTGPANFVYCRNGGTLSGDLRKYVGIFVVTMTILAGILELWVAWMIYAYPMKSQDDPTAWRTNIQFSVRILILSLLQIVTIAVSVVNLNPSINSFPVKFAYELLDSMDALAAFLTLGTQTSILLTWKSGLVQVWNFVTRKKPEEPEELQPQGYPTMDWAALPRRKFVASDSDSFETDFALEEKGLSLNKSQRLKAMLGLGKR